ncbi:hypothetical protein GCM10023100_50890 [Actinocorallia cavernae]|uniref:Transposase n=2 Tax=Actinomycetes TaxID=1760 RepID=A0ABP5YMA4_9ACTN
MQDQGHPDHEEPGGVVGPVAPGYSLVHSTKSRDEKTPPRGRRGNRSYERAANFLRVTMRAIHPDAITSAPTTVNRPLNRTPKAAKETPSIAMAAAADSARSRGAERPLADGLMS